jgi:hypothetical protein
MEAATDGWVVTGRGWEVSATGWEVSTVGWPVTTPRELVCVVKGLE